MTNALYFGDNLDILREHIRDESVDLVYLDPPFNSNASYNVLFKSPKGQQSHAQIEAFEDTWHWGDQAEREFDDLLRQPNTDVSEMMQALRRFLGENDMMAYLTMMAGRLLELRRVLKPTGSLYLHCDPTASHYLKLVLDGVFGKENFRNELIWSYRRWPSIAKQFQRMHDTIFFYTKNRDMHTFNVEYEENSESYMKRFKGKTQVLDPETGTRKIVIDEKSKGLPRRDVWELSIIAGFSKERLGYPTQKPLALLERIIQASSNPGDVVLDPFCGCGTAVHAAQKLGRAWIGIDITHLAISLVEKRLRDAFPGIAFEVHGTPKDLDGARNLAERDKYQFQWWACSLVNAQPYGGKKKGADSGIDGLIYFRDEAHGDTKKIVVSVKGGATVGPAMIRDLGHVVDREKATIGLFVTLAAPTEAMRKEAAASGFYECAHNGRRYPKLQMLTIEGLLDGRERAEYLDLSTGAETFKKAKQEKKKTKQRSLLE